MKFTEFSLDWYKVLEMKHSINIKFFSGSLWDTLDKHYTAADSYGPLKKWGIRNAIYIV